MLRTGKNIESIHPGWNLDPRFRFDKKKEKEERKKTLINKVNNVVSD